MKTSYSSFLAARTCAMALFLCAAVFAHSLSAAGVIVAGTERECAGLSVTNWKTAGVQRYINKPQQAARQKSDVYQIVVHETASPRWAGVNGPALGVQFHVDLAGGVFQHADAVDMLWHAEGNSLHSVGIENVNLVFDRDAQANPGETVACERIPITWSGGPAKYCVVPPLAQLESLHELVKALKREFSVGDNWLQVMPHPDPKIRAANPGRTYFLMMTGGVKYFTNSAKEPTIVSHSVLGGHADGAFQTLYLWLRLAKGKDADGAYQLARQIAEDAGGARHSQYVDPKTRAILHLMDVTDLI